MIPRAAYCHVEPSLRCCIGHRRDAAPVARCRYHAQEHDIPFVTLERVGVATDNLPGLHRLWAERLDEPGFDVARLRIANQADDTDCLAVVGGVSADIADCIDDRFRLSWIHCTGCGPRLIPPVHVSGHDRRFETPGAVLPKRDERLPLIREIVRELDDLGHAAEVLTQTDATLIADLREVEETLVRPVRVRMRESREVAFAKLVDVLPVHDAWRMDLLVVAHDDKLLREVGQQERLRAGLAGLIDDGDVEEFRTRLDGLRYPM